MPSKKEKHHQQQQQQVLNNIKSQTTPLGNSTNTTPIPTSDEKVPLSNSYHTVTTNHYTTTTTKKTNLNNEPTNSLDHLSLIRDQKNELDELNNRFSNYVLALRKKTKENEDLQVKVDAEKQKHKNLEKRDTNDLETQMDDLRNEIDESAVLTEHFIRKRNRVLKELALLKDKIRTEEDQTYANRRQALENEYKQTLVQLKDLSRRFEELEKTSQANKNEMNQMTDLYKKLEDELHDLVLANIRLECNLRTIEEQTLLTKAVYETEKNDLANEQLKQQHFYTVELDNAITDIKRDFQLLLKNNKVILENAYTERIEQVKTQISTYQANKPQETVSTSRVPIATLHEELKQIEKTREGIEDEYRPLIDQYVTKQKEKNQLDEERIRLDTEYTRLLSEINQLTEAIEVGKQYWFSVHFELETYRRLLDLESTNTPTVTTTVTTTTLNNATVNEKKVTINDKNSVMNDKNSTMNEKNVTINDKNTNSNDKNDIIDDKNTNSNDKNTKKNDKNIKTNVDTPVINGKEENSVIEELAKSIMTVKKTESQRSISKTGEMKKATNKNAFREGSILTCNIILGKFDIDQVQAGFISINNAATNCVDQPLKGWTIVRTVNDGEENTFQFPDSYVLKARTRVRVYSNKVENAGSSAIVTGRLTATSISAWASTGQGDNVKISLLDDKGINRAEYSETWQ
ncbi:unnamed protein product [Adineta steineri]|uniref:LTD domain-containing protein n=1 Tax=Adineta steineri TaxID=433720 RepID=A0A819N9E8_9BILA|nr:unnamed protein product [Adineta steineri]